MGFLLSGAVVLAAGIVQRQLDRADPANDQPVRAEMVSAKAVEDRATYFVTGIARYSIQGRSYESELVDTREEMSQRAVGKRLLRYAPPKQVQVFFRATGDPDHPYSISLRQGLSHETEWAYFAVLLGGVLLFTGASLYPITRYAAWAAQCEPGWVRELGFMPMFVLLVPAVVGMLFLFGWYFE